MNTTLPKRKLIQYGFLAFPIAFASLPIYILAPQYYAREYDVAIGHLGVALLLIRIVDAIAGPLLGWYCDEFPKWQPLNLIISGFIFSLGFYLVFVPIIALPVYSFIVGAIFSALAYSYFYINLCAMGALWGKNKSEKVSIAAFRESLTLIGVLFACILPTILMHFLPIRTGYQIFTLFLVLFLVIALVLFIHWYKKDYINVQSINRATFRISNYFEAFNANQAFFYTIYSFSALAIASPTVLISFFVVNYLQW